MIARKNASGGRKRPFWEGAGARKVLSRATPALAEVSQRRGAGWCCPSMARTRTAPSRGQRAQQGGPSRCPRSVRVHTSAPVPRPGAPSAARCRLTDPSKWCALPVAERARMKVRCRSLRDDPGIRHTAVERRRSNDRIRHRDIARLLPSIPGVGPGARRHHVRSTRSGRPSATRSGTSRSRHNGPWGPSCAQTARPPTPK